MTQISKRALVVEPGKSVQVKLLIAVFLAVVLLITDNPIMGYHYEESGLETLTLPTNRTTKLRNQPSLSKTPVKKSVGSKQLKTDLLEFPPEKIWRNLIKEAGAKLNETKVGIVMEVGMHRATQCLRASKAGLQAHCVEPSPTSFEKIERDVNSQDPDVKSRTHLYQVAASSDSGIKVPFSSAGSTGDHIGSGIDIWTMEKKEDESKQEETKDVVNVYTKRMDEIVQGSPEKRAYLIKVDVQGFEPQVFEGLTETINQRKADYVLFEYWPKGMDLMSESKGKCKGVAILELLAGAGYDLYALGVVAHPLAPKRWKSFTHDRPFHDFTLECQWYYQLEELVQAEEYRIGYWSDILAVAPGVSMSNPISPTGRKLEELLAK